MNIRETDLPGIGRKFLAETRSGEKLVVIVHNDGRRELYHFEAENPDDCVSSVTLDDDESRQIAAIVGGMAYKPSMLESIEVALDDLVIEWYRLEAHHYCVGKTIGELNVRQLTGATIIAVVGKNANQINPGPEFVLTADATMVVAGERQHQLRIKQLFLNGSG